MTDTKNNNSIFSLVEKKFVEVEKSFLSDINWKGYSKACDSIYEAAHRSVLPFDFRFNAVHWAFTVDSLCREIVYSFCWMKAFAIFYKNKSNQSSQIAHVDFHVSYYADNCITRIDACRDKLALMIWAFYCPFNPEKKPETLNYEGVVERLTYPVKYALNIKNQKPFLLHLTKLKSPEFKKIEKYRHYKIHRIEPRIEMFGVKSFHGWSYMFPLLSEKDINRWQKDLTKEYSNSELREMVEKGCYIDGTLFESRKIKDSIWDYSKIEEQIKICIINLIDASNNCYKILRSRAPLRKRKEA